MIEESLSHEGVGQEAVSVIVPDAAGKKELYEKSLEEIKDRVKDVDSVVSRMATIAAVLKNNIPYYLWCGFYFAEEGEMVVGPYQGTVACPNISYDGVCGESAKNKESTVVPDVHAFPGHIVCDVRSNSEIVVPLLDDKGMVIAVLDVDSSEKNAFDDIDKEFLEKYIMPILLEKEK